MQAIVYFAILFASVNTGEPVAKSIEFKTSDSVQIAADYFAPANKKEKAPVAILIHMYPADRKSWAPLIPALHNAGFAVLAYDIRGHAGSAGQISKAYDSRDPALFKA